MAFALTAFTARQIDIASPQYKGGIQEIVMKITGLTSDVDLDIGDAGGTFWTAAQANTTYGEMAAKALDIMDRLSDQVDGLVAVESPQLLDRVQVASPSGAGQYSLAIDVLGPNILFNAADGETSYLIILRYEMKSGQVPIFALYAESTP